MRVINSGPTDKGPITTDNKGYLMWAAADACQKSRILGPDISPVL